MYGIDLSRFAGLFNGQPNGRVAIHTFRIDINAKIERESHDLQILAHDTDV